MTKTVYDSLQLLIFPDPKLSIKDKKEWLGTFAATLILKNVIKKFIRKETHGNDPGWWQLVLSRICPIKAMMVLETTF